MMQTTPSHPLLHKVEQSLNSLRPYLNKDGGNVHIVEITHDFIVRVKLSGACESCPQSAMTMKIGIEEAVKRDVPEIKAVVAV